MLRGNLEIAQILKTCAAIALTIVSRLDVERKQAQAIASLPDSITHYYAYSNENFTVISLRLPVT